MNSNATRILLSLIAVLLTIGLTLAKSIDTSDTEPYQKNQVEDCRLIPSGRDSNFSGSQLDLKNEKLISDDLPLDNAIFKYMLAREILSRQRNYDLDERQRKRNYWKQCAFNAVSCFGKK